ncbi:hypothetical protein NMY22_g3982 [Coprinellus aureogranulatus]|nr:hypothetical protein NMY22_g3982 [Coprinellus aureogranulatus]
MQSALPLSQQLLWSSIHLYFDNDPSSNAHQQSMIIARKIAFEIPRFGEYVRSFVFRLEHDAQLPADSNVVSQAIANMPNIVDLSIVHEVPRCDPIFPLGMRHEPWKQSLCDILSSNKLRSVTLRRISQIPANVLANALINTAKLDMHGCFMGTMPTGATSPLDVSQSNVRQHASSLRDVTCDFVSYLSLQAIVGYFKFDEGLQPGLNLAHLHPLELVLEPFGGIPRITHAILRSATALHHLRVRSFARPQDDDVPVRTFLLELNPSSYTTLEEIHFSLDNGSIIGVTDPYMGLCSILPDLVTLRRIHLELDFVGPLGTSMEALISVNLLVRAVPLWKRAKEVKEKNDVAAQFIRAYISTVVYPTQFTHLSNRTKEGKVKFEFAVEG